MAITRKTESDLKKMRQAGLIQARILNQLGAALCPGITTKELDILARELCAKYKVRPGFLGHQGFPAAICTALNAGVVHGIPQADECLREGDIIGIDFGVLCEGFYADACQTFILGDVPRAVRNFVLRVRKSLFRGIAAARAGKRVGVISHAIQAYIEQFGYGIVRETVGHGIGRELHEDPKVPNFGSLKSGPILRPGMTLCLEPIITMGSPRIKTAKDGWTLSTEDGSLAAHFEHQILITEGEPEILTPWHLGA